MFNLLFVRFNPGSHHNYGLCQAAQYGQVKIVKLLLKDPRVDPSDEENYPLRKSASNGHLPVVRELLKHPKVDPGSRNFSAYYRAANPAIKKVLLKKLKQGKNVFQIMSLKIKMSQSKQLILYE